jgi:hypothetical protein
VLMREGRAVLIVVRFHRPAASCALSRSLREDCLIRDDRKGFLNSRVPATRAGGVLMRDGFRVDCGSIPHTACELRSFSLIERRMLCWVGRVVRFRLVFDDAEREKRDFAFAAS